MQKIISLFKRNYDGDRLVRNEVVEGAEWVANGEGVATRKWNGTCCMVRAGVLYRRYDAKHGKTPPKDFMPAQDPDPVTGHWPGWVPVGSGPADIWHNAAFGINRVMPDGTYELCGPKVQGNAEHLTGHVLIRHGAHVAHDAPRTFDELKRYFSTYDIEGIVWHHPDGRMVKIKAKDFGIRRGESA